MFTKVLKQFVTKFDLSSFAPNVVDNDTSLSANADERLATQKAIKSYADTKLAKDGNLSGLADLEEARRNMGLGSEATNVGVVAGTVQHTVISDTLSPQFNQRRKRQVGNGDVTTGSVIAKWDGAGWLNGAFRFASRVTWFVHTAVGSVLRAKMKINVTNAEGTDWPAFHFSEQGYLGIGNAKTFNENDPECSLDVAGETASNGYGFRARAQVIPSAGVIDVSNYSYVSLLGGTTTITDIISGDAYAPYVFLVSASGTITIKHDTTKIRCRGGQDVTVTALQGGVTFVKIPNSSIWEQIS